MTRSLIVVGAGTSGLGAALALSRAGFRVRLLDKDPPPPTHDVEAEGSADPEREMDELFADWRRPGVAQLRHSHVFLARLYTLLRDEYPRLLERLLEAGCRELRFGDGLPPHLKERYRPQPGDEDFTMLSSRRTTLEYVMRRYVQEETAVEIESGVRVDGLLWSEEDGEGGEPPRVAGVRVVAAPRRDASTGELEPTRDGGERGDGGDSAEAARDLRADAVVDASGHRTPFPGWLAERGVEISSDIAETGILYFTRHYKLRPGREEPERGRLPGNGDIGYVRWAIFPADNRCFSITIAVPECEPELRREITKPEVFDFVCSQLLGVQDWTDPERSEPRSKVYGMGKLRSEWRSYLDDGGRARVAGLFPVGDSLVRTNPLYGRGCSSGVLEAHLLAQALREGGVRPEGEEEGSSLSGELLERYLELVETEIRPHFESMRRQDRQSIRRSELQLEDDPKPNVKERFGRAFLEDMLRPALRGDLVVLRAFLPGFHMLARPDDWLRFGIWLRLLRVWLRGKRRNEALGLRLPRLGPSRAEMFRELGLS